MYENVKIQISELNKDKERVEFITRDINGKSYVRNMPWDEVNSFVTANECLNEEEILIVAVNGRAIYSSLTSPAITWDDLTGFFG